MPQEQKQLPGIEWVETGKIFKDIRPQKEGRIYYLKPSEVLEMAESGIYIKTAEGQTLLDEWEGLKEKE